jgi:hypothetical protein
VRDVHAVSLGGNETLIIASDNSGGIGQKKEDIVHVPYDVVAYFNFRVAAMETIAAGAEPFSVVIQNFCGESAWEEITSGVKRGLTELGLRNVGLTGSTETNFTLEQSALGLVVLGKRKGEEPSHLGEKLAVIGSPLVGDEVLYRSNEIIPLSLFQRLAKMKDVTIFPVGSKGILYEVNELLGKSVQTVDTEVDVYKSAGPSTCIAISFPSFLEREIMIVAGELYHSINYFT